MVCWTPARVAIVVQIFVHSHVTFPDTSHAQYFKSKIELNQVIKNTQDQHEADCKCRSGAMCMDSTNWKSWPHGDTTLPIYLDQTIPTFK